MLRVRRRTFVTGNYEITTCSAIEWAFVATPDEPPSGGWPGEARLRRALQPTAAPEECESLEQLVKSGAKMRQPMPRAALEKKLEDVNLQLDEIKEPRLMLAEGVAARLYTGALFVKYNGVLRGLDSTVPPGLAPCLRPCISSAAPVHIDS